MRGTYICRSAIHIYNKSRNVGMTNFEHFALPESIFIKDIIEITDIIGDKVELKTPYGIFRWTFDIVQSSIAHGFLEKLDEVKIKDSSLLNNVPVAIKCDT